MINSYHTSIFFESIRSSTSKQRQTSLNTPNSNSTRRNLYLVKSNPLLKKTNRCETSGGIFSDRRGNISRGSQMFGLHTPFPINRNRFHIGGPAAYPPFGVEIGLERRLSCFQFSDQEMIYSPGLDVACKIHSPPNRRGRKRGRGSNSIERDNWTEKAGDLAKDRVEREWDDGFRCMMFKKERREKRKYPPISSSLFELIDN